jgi:mercuric reductase
LLHEGKVRNADADSIEIIGVRRDNTGDVISIGMLAIKFGLMIEDLKDSFAPCLTMPKI